MSIVQPFVPDAQVLDLCAGSGALGLEMLSRGAAHCDFVEQSPSVLKVLEANIQALGAGERAAVHKADAVEFARKLADGDGSLKTEGNDLPSSIFRPYQVALTDPPYGKGIAEALAAIWLGAPFSDIFGIEHEAGLVLPDPPQGPPADRRRYGDTALTIYRATA